MGDQSEEFLKALSNSVDVSFEPIFVFPGQDVTAAVTKFKKSIKIGDGLIQTGSIIRTTVAGTLRYREPVSYWVRLSKYGYAALLTFSSNSLV